MGRHKARIMPTCLEVHLMSMFQDGTSMEWKDLLGSLVL